MYLNVKPQKSEMTFAVIASPHKNAWFNRKTKSCFTWIFLVFTNYNIIYHFPTFMLLRSFEMDWPHKMASGGRHWRTTSCTSSRRVVTGSRIALVMPLHLYTVTFVCLLACVTRKSLTHDRNQTLDPFLQVRCYSNRVVWVWRISIYPL